MPGHTEVPRASLSHPDTQALNLPVTLALMTLQSITGLFFLSLITLRAVLRDRHEAQF